LDLILKNQYRPKIIVLAGPTAAGKTSAGMELARRFNGEIVSADSVQLYRRLDIGSAKPTRMERQMVRHHMIDIREPDEDFSAGDYVREAGQAINEIADAGGTPIIVGGTGLYIRLLLRGIADLPKADNELRKRYREIEATQGPYALHEILREKDPQTAENTPKEHITRIIRALEVYDLTGRRISEALQEHGLSERPYDHIFFCLAPQREVLYERIDKRVDIMINGGLIDEARSIIAMGFDKSLKPLQSLGYRHALMVIEGKMDLSEATELMKRDTRRYAKRQLTWFSSEPEVMWFDTDDIATLSSKAGQFLGRA
jgi:tRNA dimethylallyltransferase